MQNRYGQIVIVLPNRLIHTVAHSHSWSTLEKVKFIWYLSHIDRLQVYVSRCPYGSFVFKLKSSLTTLMIIDENDKKDLLINVANEDIRKDNVKWTKDKTNDKACLMMIVYIEWLEKKRRQLPFSWKRTDDSTTTKSMNHFDSLVQGESSADFNLINLGTYLRHAWTFVIITITRQRNCRLHKLFSIQWERNLDTYISHRFYRYSEFLLR